MTKQDRLYYLWFGHFNRIGPANLKHLENYFPSLETAFTSSRFDLIKAGLKENLVEEFISWRKSFNLGLVQQELAKEKINFITWHDPEYPALLLEIPSPPPILYYKGQLDTNVKNHLAVVGSRQHSAYADKIISALLTQIAVRDIEIISGLALGVDGLAHRAALQAEGRTVAILGSGLNAVNIYPGENRQLAEAIINSGGAIISEFSPGTPPYKQNFPQRNRIIAGLAQATLVIESKEKSGALITAAYALEQNREVLAIPGNIFSEFSCGPNNLIKAGAKTITGVNDILEVFKITENSSPDTNKLRKIRPANTKKSNNYRPTSNIEMIIYTLLREASERQEAITTDEISKKTKLDTATINSTLSMLEIAGIAKNTESGYDLN